MSNKLFLIVLVLPVLLGCGLSERIQEAVTESTSNTNGVAANVNANKSLTDKAVDTAVGEQKIGIQECDEAMDILTAQAENPDDNFVTKAIKKTALNTFREQLKRKLEENKADKAQIAKYCSDFRNNLADSLRDANTNTNTATDKSW
ncbi:MAG TPA: hypothetical protein VFZ23_11840 [Pyrinomonadaceae bacterium]